MRNIPYEVRLKALNLHYLERYRLKGDRTEVFKGYNNCTKVDMNKVLGSIAKIEPEVMSKLENTGLRKKWKATGSQKE